MKDKRIVISETALGTTIEVSGRGTESEDANRLETGVKIYKWAIAILQDSVERAEAELGHEVLVKVHKYRAGDEEAFRDLLSGLMEELKSSILDDQAS